MAKEHTRTKREQAADARAEHRRMVRRRALVRRGIIGAILAAVAASVGFCAFREHQISSALKTASYPGGQHLAGPISYRESPPLGGTHNVIWQNCGTYDVPIHNEHAVHALEHGAVWITYRPDLPADQVERLKALAADDYLLLSPYPGLDAPVVASAWNNQIALDGADDPRLPRFISRFKNNPSSTPEFGAPCTGGTFANAQADTLQTSGAMAR